MYTNYSNIKQNFGAPKTGSQKWLKRINQIMEIALYNPTMNNLKMAEALNISERELFRKVKRITGMSPQRYFRQYRIHRAMHYLKEGKYRTVKGTGQAVGYANISYFILQFEKEFGKKPLQVLKEQGWR